jgi:hypothetical protein
MKKLTTHLRSNVIGYVALFFAMSAGAYAAGLAPNSVKSKHIKDGHVQNADIGVDAVAGAHVANSSLGGADLAPNSVGGQQIDESSLGTVAMAAQGGTGRYGYTGECDPESDTYVACSTAAVPHSKPGRLLIIGQVTAATEVDSDNARGGCQIEVDESPIQASRMEFYFHDDGTGLGEFGLYGTENATLVAVSDVLPAGTQTAGIACYQDESTGAIRYPRVRMVGVSLSDG